MDAKLKAKVRRRADFRCEYCHFPEIYSELRFQIDHILARKHQGRSNVSNLALSCFRCNTHKGSNLAGLDPLTRRLVRLFNPRTDEWTSHFTWDGPRLKGLTAVGRTTIAVLCINRSDAVLLRSALMQEGVRLT